MAWSDPQLISAEIPTEIPPGSTTSVPVNLRETGNESWASNHSCSQGIFDNTGWIDQVSLVVDGTEYDRQEKCVQANGGEETFSLSIPALNEGTHTVKVQAWSVGGSAYDMRDPDPELNDEIIKTVTANPDAEDPSNDNGGNLIERLTEMLGGSTRSLLMAGAIAFAVFMVI